MIDCDKGTAENLSKTLIVCGEGSHVHGLVEAILTQGLVRNKEDKSLLVKIRYRGGYLLYYELWFENSSNSSFSTLLGLYAPSPLEQLASCAEAYD